MSKRFYNLKKIIKAIYFIRVHRALCMEKSKLAYFVFSFHSSLHYNYVHNQDSYTRFFPLLLYILEFGKNQTMIFKYVSKYTLN